MAAAGVAGAGADAPRIGVAIGTVGATPQWWLESAIRLEAAGYRALWAWDQLQGRGDKTVPVVEQWTILSAAAGATSRIGLGTFITNVMLREPAMLARMAGTLQEASGGRLTVGLGIGGGAKAMGAYGFDFPAPDERVRRLEEAVAVMRALWTGGPITRESEFYPLAEAHAFPVPKPAPRILVGAQSPGGVRLAARIGDGWAAEVPAFTSYLDDYLEALEASGKARSEVSIVLGFGGEEKSGANALDDSPWVSDPLAEWQRWHTAGADEVIVTARTQSDVDKLVSSR
jgi:alkanesulfonate monooxygenase SsuD/methylene tetrahydromethanopterin reductase-like flavin-dependent oxidoreductase (luciferase family)